MPPLFFVGCYFPLGRWCSMLKSWLKVSLFGIHPVDSTPLELRCPILICASIPHLTIPWYHAILIILLRPLVAFQSILKRH